MESEPEEKLVFEAQWYQSEASVNREFLLNFFTKDNSLEMVNKYLPRLTRFLITPPFQIDTKAKKVFLRRIPVDTICAKDLFPGARIFVFGRKIHVTGYGNLDTKQLLGSKSQKAFLLVPGQNKSTLDSVFRKISDQNVKLDNCFMRQLSSDDLVRVNLLEDERIAPVKYNLLNEPSILFELSGKSMDKKIEDIQEACPGSFGCQSEEVLEFFFKEGESKQKLPRNENKKSVLCIIKPHIVHSNLTGDVLEQIYRQGFVVANIKLCHWDRDQTDDFLRVYEGVLPEFIQMSIHLASGPMIAMELINAGGDASEDIHTKFRNLCGPYDTVSNII